MSQQELLTYVVDVLRHLRVDFMLTGSHASSLQGEARATHDVDLVVDLHAEQVDPLINAFSSDRFYLSKSAVVDAIQTQRMFNLLETTTGEKVDFWLLSDSPFDTSRFQRRVKIDVGGLFVDVSAPEDTILMKLLWCKQSGLSSKQLNDVTRVYELQADLLDRSYVESWLERLGVEDLWRRVLNEAEPIDPSKSSTP